MRRIIIRGVEWIVWKIGIGILISLCSFKMEINNKYDRTRKSLYREKKVFVVNLIFMFVTLYNKIVF